MLDMRPFLGQRDSVVRLQRDITDLQRAILDVFSRTGPARFPSWKFPHKLSCWVDIAALLDQYCFKDGDDAFNQNSHVILLELVIDRMLLLLQSFSVYMEHLMLKRRRDHTLQKECVSIGVVVRHSWSNLLELTNSKVTGKDIERDAIMRTDDVKSISSVSSIVSSDAPLSLSASSSSSSFKFCPQSGAEPEPPTSPQGTLSSPKTVSAGTRNAGAQTTDPSVVPCTACVRMQALLKHIGDSLAGLFRAEGLPCSLEAMLAAVGHTVELGHLTGADVTQWASDQRKDMRRLTKHIKEVRRTVKPLREKLAAAESEREQQMVQAEQARDELERERAQHRASTARLQQSLHEARRAARETEQQHQEDNTQLRKENSSLEEQIAQLRLEVAEHREALLALEREKTSLQEEVESLHVKEEAHRDVEAKLESQMSQTQILLDIEGAKYQSACRQQESMQVKQRSLLERVDALDQEHEELLGQLGDSQDRETQLQNQLRNASEQMERLQTQITQQQALCLELQKEKRTMQAQVCELEKTAAELKGEAEHLRQRERLLVAFPELNPLMQAQPQSTGDVLLDMEQQLQTNCVRINVLEQENANLHRSLLKLRERQQSCGILEAQMIYEASPQDAWGLSPLNSPREDQHGHTTHNRSRTLISNTQPRCEGKKTGRGQSGLASAGSEDPVSSSCSMSSTSSSSHLHVQTLRFTADYSALRTKAKSHGASHLPRARGPNRRKMWHP